MPSTGIDKSPSPAPNTDASGSSSGASSKALKPGSMKVKRTASGAKLLTKSKSSGSLKKKGEVASGSGSGGGGSSGRHAKDVQRTSSASAEMELLDPKHNGSLRRGGVGGGGGGGEEEVEGEEVEVWGEGGEERKEPSIKGLWKKAFKNMKPPGGSDSKWLNRPSFKRRDSRYDSEEVQEEEPKEIDPVYSLLKCAADLPKITRTSPKEGGQTSGCQGQHCMGRASSPSPQGLSQLSLSGGGSCVSCRGVHQSSNEDSSIQHSLGHDFKEFYKQTSPIKRLSSSSELGI
ncbi:uncharacterized protein LOC143301462 [Babylonia areolata]|uniref:uncharacterized protein LOC143301462 n=1 Tax=Babylonia areolata TaxID=304850 RepID=UPI003FD50A96